MAPEPATAMVTAASASLPANPAREPKPPTRRAYARRPRSSRNTLDVLHRHTEPSPASLVDFVKGYLDAVLRRDFSSLEMLLAPDVTASIHTPELATIRGRARLLEVLRTMAPAYTSELIRIDPLTPTTAIAKIVLRMEVDGDQGQRARTVHWRYEVHDDALVTSEFIEPRAYDRLIRAHETKASEVERAHKH